MIEISFIKSSEPRIDFHVHLAPVLSDQALRDTGTGRGDDGRLRIGTATVGPSGLYDRAGLGGFLNGVGVDYAVVSPPPPFFRQDLHGVQRDRWVSALNAGTLAAVAGEPRLLALAYLPLDDPDAARAEYERHRHDGRWAGVCGCAGGGSRSLAGDGFDALWSALERDSTLLFLHPGMSRIPGWRSSTCTTCSATPWRRPSPPRSWCSATCSRGIRGCA